MKNNESIPAITEEEYLAHYGVKGMHWGVWNAETARKRAGGNGRHSFRTNVSKKTNSVKARRASAKKEKELKKYNALREKTLKSHDPIVVEKGMHTLSDEELSSKIKRLETEKKIRDLSTAKQTSVYDIKTKQESYRKTKKERRAAGLSGYAAKTAYNATVTFAGHKIVDSVFANIAKGGGGQASVKAGKSLVEEFFGGRKKNPVGFD